MSSLLAACQLEKNNPGGSTGAVWWSQLQASQRINSFNPTSNQLIASVDGISAAEYEKIVLSAKKAFEQWRMVPAPKRGELVRQMGERLRQQKNALSQLVSLEMGKSKAEGEGEVQEMIDMADFAVGQSRMLYGLSMHSERIKHRMYEQWQPMGVVAIITAFNFPVAVWAWNAFIAAICGNTCIWKPSSKTPLSAIAVQHICNTVMQENGFEGIFNLMVTRDNDLVLRLTQDTNIPLVSFTGSTAIGLKVQSHVADRMGRSLLELSGNNAIIIDETANKELALKATFFSAVGTAGQRCTTARRLFLHDSIYESFIAKLQAAYEQVKIGDPLDPKNHLGPLIDQQAVDGFLKAVSEAKAQGGKILSGGHQIKKEGCFVEPTLIAAENHWPIVQAETFAPILYVMKYHDLSQAISEQNAVKQGLSSSLFSQSLAHIELFLSALGSDCGIANINQGTSGAEIGGAFGGEKWTGGGREAGSDAWKHYMRRQTVTINWGEALPLAQGIEFGHD